MDLSLQAPLSVGFFRQQYWSGLPFPPPRDLPDPGIKPTSPELAGRLFLSPILLIKFGVLWHPRGWGGVGGGREIQEGGTYVCLWLIHINIWQKPVQYCTTIILQLKINEKVTSVYLRTFKFFVVVLVLQSCLTLCDLMDCDPSDPSVHEIFPGRYTGVGCRFLLWGVFLAQGRNPCLLHWQARSLPVSHLGSHLSPYSRNSSSCCLFL